MVWIEVGCPCPPVRNDIVTPRHLFYLGERRGVEAAEGVFSMDDGESERVADFVDVDHSVPSWMVRASAAPSLVEPPLPASL